MILPHQKMKNTLSKSLNDTNYFLFLSVLFPIANTVRAQRGPGIYKKSIWNVFSSVTSMSLEVEMTLSKNINKWCL